MNITKEAIEKTRITITVLVLIAILGLMSYKELPKSEDPGYVVRAARVVTFFPGASPERVENLVTDKLEEVIEEIPELDWLDSESRTGLSIITVNISEKYSDMRPIWDNLRRKVAKARNNLPKGIQGPFVNDEFGDVFGTNLTITGAGFSYRELQDAAKEIRNQLLFFDDVGKVDIYGEQEERIFIEYNDAKLEELGLSATELKKMLESQNIISPGGELVLKNERIIVEPTGNYESVADIEDTLIHIPGHKEVLYLKDFTTVRRGYIEPPQNLVRASGTPALDLAISLREGGNITRLGRQLAAFVDELKQKYPIGFQFEFVTFQSDIVQEKVHNFVINLCQSVAIVILVMLFSLGLRTGLVVASLIPMTIFATFALMPLFHIGIDQISLAALIIALGMLVDNAIVMSEQIMTEVSKGKQPKEAAIAAAKELRIPLLTSSLTTIAAFLPIYLAKSAAGEYTGSIFVVVAIALLSSWILSLTMIPVLCVNFLHFEQSQVDYEHNPFFKKYRAILEKLLRYRWLFVASLAALFCLALWGLHFIPKLFFPPSERALFTIEFEMPTGTKIERTETVIQNVEAYFKKELVPSGITTWATFIGGAAPRYVINYNPKQPSPEKAFMIVNAASYQVMPDVMKKIETFIRNHFPSMRATIRKTEYGPPVATPIAIRIEGSNQDKLFEIVDQVKAELREIGGVKNIRDNWGQEIKKLVIDINQPRALRAGITNEDIAVSLKTVLSGYETTQYREKDELIPVILRSFAAQHEDLDHFETLNVYSQNSQAVVPLKQVADAFIVWEPNKIMRRNRMKAVSIEADLETGANANEIITAISPWLSQNQKRWPPGYNYEFGGEAEASTKASSSIYKELPLAALLIILLLVIQFNSFRKPLIICLTIPLGFIGVIIGLFLTGSYMGFMTILGVVSLSGIVINNAIVLIDKIWLEIVEEGKKPSEAIIHASQSRLRPILLTTLTTVGGLLPLWLSGGQMFQPLAIAIIFGLLFATVLTLGFVPVLYSLLYRVDYE